MSKSHIRTFSMIALHSLRSMCSEILRKRMYSISNKEFLKYQTKYEKPNFHFQKIKLESLYGMT